MIVEVGLGEGCISVGNGVGVLFGVFVGVGVGIRVPVGALVGVGAVVGVGVNVGVFTGVAVGVGILVGVVVGIRVGVGVVVGIVDVAKLNVSKARHPSVIPFPSLEYPERVLFAIGVVKLVLNDTTKIVVLLLPKTVVLQETRFK